MSFVSKNPLLLAYAQQEAAGGISRSLRFNSSDSAFCSRTPSSAGNRRTWTLSLWVKRSGLGAYQRIFNSRNPGVAADYIRFNNDDTLELYLGAALITTQVFRDPSSWYHLVIAVDTTQATSGNRVKLYVNGSQVSTFGTANYPSQNADTLFNATLIHTLGTGDGTTEYFSGYLADIIFVDGQALTPSSFTEVSATTGQLIPKQYTGSFGTNGFWLKFSDNSAATATTLGKDYSGNNNNWTPNNFSVLSSYTDTFLSRKPDGTSWTNPTYAFDGTTANYADGTAGNGTVSTIRFNKPLTGVTLLEYFYDGTSTYGYNSTDVGTGPNLTGGSWVTVYSGSAITVNNVRCTSQPGNGVVRLYAIRVNGTILNNWTETDPPGCDSTVDTPTSYGTDDGLGGSVRGNYCTWNPLDKASNTTLSNGNLDVNTSGGTTNNAFGTTRASFGLSSGKWYWEVTPTSFTDGGILGIMQASASLVTAVGQDANGWGYLNGGNKYTNASASSYGASWTTNDVIGVAFDADAGTLTFYKNGSSQGTAFTGLTSGPYFPSISDNAGSSTTGSTFVVNFGQRPWAFPSSVPSGFKALCDTNLPAPVVAKPNTVMDVKLYTGTGSNQAVTGLGFSPDFVWIKRRNLDRSHMVFDAVRGLPNRLATNETSGDNTDANNLVSFDSTGFTTSTGDAVNGSGGTYVAWTWDAGTTTASNPDGSITSQVRANPSAGFSVVTWTGNGSNNQSVGHGLGVSPDIVIIKCRSTATSWHTYVRALDSTGRFQLYLNSTSGSVDFGTPFFSPTSSLINLIGGTSVGINGSGSTYVAYCFAPVAGYSSFGSYVGNGSSDGVFVYTGHRPRWILLKATSIANESWIIIDTARSTYNVVDAFLRADTSGAEFSSSLRYVDILSNGFKLRASGTEVNGSGTTYVYASFAESPFAYSRAR